MKKSFILLMMSILVPLSTTYADYFESAVLDNYGVETDRVQAVVMTVYTFRDQRDSNRYQNAKRIVDGIKDESVARIKNGNIPYYRQYDIIRDLDAFVHTLNQHFAFRKRYEQTGRDAYAVEATKYLGQSRQAYERLKNTLSKSAW